jgi:hypothetical protein
MAPLKHASALRERAPRPECQDRIASNEPRQPAGPAVTRYVEKIASGPSEADKLIAPPGEKIGRVVNRGLPKDPPDARRALRKQSLPSYSVASWDAVAAEWRVADDARPVLDF